MGTDKAPRPAAAGGDRHTRQARVRAADDGTQDTARGKGKGTGRTLARAAAPGEGGKDMSRVQRLAASGCMERARTRSADEETAKDTGKDAGRTRASAERARAQVTEVGTGGTDQRATETECARGR